jgi:endonuclease YncB( thermonuclease family)
MPGWDGLKWLLILIMSGSPSRRRHPLHLFLGLAVIALGWLYNQFASSPPSSRNNVPVSRTLPSPASALKAGDLQSDIVMRVADGDSLELQHGGRIRMVGVDCPEHGQAGGREAAAFARAALLGKTIKYRLCAEQPRDQYGRGLGFIYIQQDGQRVLFNSEMIRQGYARVYSGRSCEIDKKLWNTYYEEARQNKRGLFATLGEVPDAAVYRHENKRNR